MAVRPFHRRTLLAASCAAGALLAAQGAMAQTVASQPGAAAQAATSLPEVVVTAQKRVENVQNVPEQVTVVSSQFIDQIHATNLADLAAYVPGLQAISGGVPGQVILGLRGITPISSNVTVGSYIDDVPVGGSSLYSNAALYSLDLLPYDVTNIEVLSGPQGTLYGASTLGGLLKYELSKPNLNTYHGEVGGDLLGVQNGDGVGGGARGTITGPILPGTLGFVASYAYENTPGYVDDAQTGQKGENEVNQQGARLGLLWTPDNRLRVELNALYQQVDADGLAEVALNATTLQPIAGELKDNNYTPQPFRKDINILADRTSYDLGFADLTSVTSYEYSDLKSELDYSRYFGTLVTAVGGPDPTLSPEFQNIKLRKYTEEVRLASKSNARFEWLVGGFVTYEHSTLIQVVPLENPDGSTITAFPAPALGGLEVYSPLAAISLGSIYREYAMFGDFTWHIMPRLDLEGGVRYSYNSQDFHQVTAGSLEAPQDAYGHSNDNVATFNVSPSYHITNNINAYLRFASGYQPGGPNVALPGVPRSVSSDTLNQYEAGLKTQFLERRATLDLAAFYNQWHDIQVSALSASDISYIANGGEAKSEGFDANGSFVVLPGLTVGGTFDYTYAVFTKVLPGNGLGAVAGDPLPQTPRFSGSVEANYAHPLVGQWSYGLGAALRLQDFRYLATNYSDLFYREPGYGALDANISVHNDRYTVRLFAKNLTDTRAYSDYSAANSALTGMPPQVSGLLIQPRTVGVSVDARF